MLLELIRRVVWDGGPMNVPTVMLSVLSLGIMLERGWFWARRMLSWDLELRRELRHVSLDDRRVLLSRDPVVSFLATRKQEKRFEVLRAAAEEEVATLHRGLGVMGFVTQVATSLGLFGTVVGISMSFGSFVSGEASSVAQGLAVALYTTVVGLAVFLYTFLGLAVLSWMAKFETRALEDALGILEEHAKGGAP